jgi:arylsulfatase A-like enzyme
LLRYPKGVDAKTEGQLLRAFTTVADLTPTILEMAGVTHPVPPGQDRGTWGCYNVAGMRGKSWKSWLADGKAADQTCAVHTEDDPAFGWELFGRAGM